MTTDTNMRYMLFAGENYYPSGGMSDYRGHFDTMQAVVMHLGSCDWFNVFDTKTGLIYDQAYTHAIISKSSEDILAWAAETDARDAAWVREEIERLTRLVLSASMPTVEQGSQHMPTLGQRLQANIDNMERQHITQEARANAEKLAAELARKQEIQAQLETYKRQISDAVYAGTVFKSVKLPKKWTLYSNDAQSIAHPNQL